MQRWGDKPARADLRAAGPMPDPRAGGGWRFHKRKPEAMTSRCTVWSKAPYGVYAVDMGILFEPNLKRPASFSLEIPSKADESYSIDASDSTRGQPMHSRSRGPRQERDCRQHPQASTKFAHAGFGARPVESEQKGDRCATEPVPLLSTPNPMDSKKRNLDSPACCGIIGICRISI